MRHTIPSNGNTLPDRAFLTPHNTHTLTLLPWQLFAKSHLDTIDGADNCATFIGRGCVCFLAEAIDGRADRSHELQQPHAQHERDDEATQRFRPALRSERCATNRIPFCERGKFNYRWCLSWFPIELRECVTHEQHIYALAHRMVERVRIVVNISQVAAAARQPICILFVICPHTHAFRACCARVRAICKYD